MQKKADKVNILREDMEKIRTFFETFDIDVPPSLKKLLIRIEKVNKITLKHQEKLKSLIMECLIGNQKHELLRSDLFKEILIKSEKEWFNNQFISDFENYVASEDKTR